MVMIALDTCLKPAVFFKLGEGWDGEQTVNNPFVPACRDDPAG
jgi:hypothetical protein